MRATITNPNYKPVYHYRPAPRIHSLPAGDRVREQARHRISTKPVQKQMHRPIHKTSPAHPQQQGIHRPAQRPQPQPQQGVQRPVQKPSKQQSYRPAPKSHTSNSSSKASSSNDQYWNHGRRR